jgi:hypothetical protein
MRIRTLDLGSLRPWIRDNQIRIRDLGQTSRIRNTGRINKRFPDRRSVSTGGQKRGSKRALLCYALIVRTATRRASDKTYIMFLLGTSLNIGNGHNSFSTFKTDGGKNLIKITLILNLLLNFQLG